MGILKLVMLGSGGVGKSAITMQYVNSTFVNDYDPTIENSYRKQVTVDDEAAMLDVLDTAGQEEYAAMRDSQIRSGMGFLCVYSITSRESFSNVREFRDRILQVKDEDSYPFVLVGNKCDLVKDREVSREDGEKLAKEFDVPFVEASAKARINIDEAYAQCIRLVRQAEANGLYDESSENAFSPARKSKKSPCAIL